MRQLCGYRPTVGSGGVVCGDSAIVVLNARELVHSYVSLWVVDHGGVLGYDGFGGMTVLCNDGFGG